jgi:hypothetical protein
MLVMMAFVDSRNFAVMPWKLIWNQTMTMKKRERYHRVEQFLVNWKRYELDGTRD